MPASLVAQHVAGATSPERACGFIAFSRFLLLIPQTSLEQSLIFTRAQFSPEPTDTHKLGLRRGISAPRLPTHPSFLLPVEDQIR